MASSWKWLLIAGAILFFMGSTVLWTIGSSELFVSPDETANHWFIREFVRDGDLRIAEPINDVLDGFIHPRSTVALGGFLVPAGFLGLPTLYGGVALLLGLSFIPLLTSVLALIAVFCFRRLIKEWFDEKTANVTTLVLLFHPALWYYTARFLMPNVLFVSLVVFAAFLWFARPLKNAWSPLLSGVLLGLAFFVRVSEVYWLVPLIMALAVWKWKKIQKQDLIWFVVGGLIGTIPFFVMNTLTYGDPMTTGYTLPTDGGGEQGVKGSGTRESLFFPFGIDLRSAARNIFDYGLALFWWLSALALIGFVRVWKSHRSYAVTFFLLALWLGVWYGSWVIHDNPDPTRVTIANSYVRYWLPVFVLSTPLVAVGVVWLSGRFSRAFVPVSLACIALLGVWATFFSGQDGLWNVARTLARSREIREEVFSIAEPDAVMIVDRADKLFVPRRVTYPLRDERTYALMPRILEFVPLYYYGITLPQQDMDYLNGRKLKDMGLQIQHLRTFDEESLYRIY